MAAINKDKRLSVEEIRELFTVDIETGDVFWRKRGMGRHLGKPAGTVMKSGYRKIGLRVDGNFVQFYAHHIVWTWCYGEWPTATLDHVDGDKDANGISNLREASYGQNISNRGALKTNACGLKWVCLHKNSVERGKKKVWQAAVWRDGRPRQSYFETRGEAFTWACAIAQQLHGEFYNSGNGSP